MKIFRGALLIACCWALTTAAPAPQTPVDAFAEDIGPEPPLNAFLKTLTTVTDLLNRFSRTFTAPAEYTEFSDVEVAKPRVTLVEEKDASGADVYKVTIVRPADSGATFARQMESTTGAPPAPSSTTTTVAPTQDPPMVPAPSNSPPPSPSPTPAPSPPPSSTTQNPALIAAEIERTLRTRLREIALQLEQEENRQEMEQDRQEMELEQRRIQAELQGRQAERDFELQQEELERRRDLEDRRRELALEQATLDQERAILGQLKVADGQQGQAAADQTAAGATVTRVIRFESREDHSEERLLRALQRQNPNIQIVPRRNAPITTVVDGRGRPIRVRYDSPELSLEDRLRYGTNPKLVQVGRDGAQPVYRFADSDEILYSTLHQPSQKATADPARPAPLVKQPLVAAPVAPQPLAVDTLVELPSQGLRTRDTIHQQQQPKYHTKHELFSDEEKKDASVYPPILFLLKNPRRQQFLQQQQRSQPISYQPFEREDIDSMEDINRSGNRLDEDEAGEGEFAEFEREWHFHPQPHFGDDMRVNRIFRTRNADYYNPDAESFHVPSSPQRVVYRPQAPQIPIK